MQRQNIKELININNDFVKDGTAAMYLALNPKNNKTGILKENGCMLGIYEEDLREKLASELLNLCDIPCASIDLFTDDNKNNYCFSYNVLKENEKHICLATPFVVDEGKSKKEIFECYMENTFASIISLPGITQKEYLEIRQRIIELYFVDLIIDHYDRKNDNHKIIYDVNSKKYKAPIAYDYGAAFNPNSIQKHGLFFYLSNEDVMLFLLKNYFFELKDLVLKIRKTLNEQALTKVLSKPEYDSLNPSVVYKQINSRINQMNEMVLAQKSTDLSVQEFTHKK